MAEPTRIRAQLKGDVAEIRVQLMHPMETGQRKNPQTGQPIPAHFIQTMTLDVGGRRVLENFLGTAVSRNPVFGFKVSGCKAGEKVVVSWADNRGDRRTDEVVLQS